MAVRVTREVVCDEGYEKCDNSDLVKVQLVVDGRRAVRVLCQKHVEPFRRMLEKMGGTPKPKRGKVYTEAEIAAKKRPARTKV